MILLADSGSTKTDWRLIDSLNPTQAFTTQGINPYFNTEEQVLSILKNELSPQIKTNLQNLQIFFYGAGCGSEVKNNILEKALQSCFPKATVEINNDLLAASRAVCGSEEGLVAILGTGANTCYYDGNKIIKNIDSLGYILGDEGSGAHIGLNFIKAYLNKELPTKIAEDFFNEYKIGKEEILDSVYTKEKPNRYLASFNEFILKNNDEPFISDLIKSCFISFFNKHICKYANHKTLELNIVGSIGFYYKDILISVAKTKGVKIGKVIKAPIEELARFHIEQEQ